MAIFPWICVQQGCHLTATCQAPYSRVARGLSVYCPWVGWASPVVYSFRRPWIPRGLSVGRPWVTRGFSSLLDRPWVLVAHESPVSCMWGPLWVANGLPTGCPWADRELFMGWPWTVSWVINGLLVGHPWVARGSPMGFRRSSMHNPCVASPVGSLWVTKQSPAGYPWSAHGLLVGCRWVTVGCTQEHHA